MRTYRVFKHDERGYCAVKEGFSWPAFIITGIWVLFNKLWIQAIAFLIAGFIVSLLSSTFFPQIYFYFMSILLSGVSLFFGFAGNEWRSDRRKKEGYKLLERVKANSEDDAVLKYREKIGDVDPLHYAEMPSDVETTPDGTYCVRGRIFSHKEDAIRHSRNNA